MKKQILSTTILIIIITSFSLLAENKGTVLNKAKTSQTISKLDTNKSINKTGVKNGFHSVLVSFIKSTGLHKYIKNSTRFNIIDVPGIINNNKKVLAGHFNFSLKKLEIALTKDSAVWFIVTAIAICGGLIFVTKQSFIPFITRYFDKTEINKKKTLPHRIFVFFRKSYPALITFLVYYSLICFINKSTLFSNVLFWGFGGWLFISLYKTIINYILSPHKIKSVYHLHETTSIYIRDTIRTISLYLIIYIVFVNILNVIKIDLSGRFIFSQLFIILFSIVNLIYFRFAFSKTAQYLYGKISKNIHKPEKIRVSKLFQVVSYYLYISITLFFCSELVLILMGYFTLTINIGLWYCGINGSIFIFLIIKYFPIQEFIERNGGGTATQNLTTWIYINPFKILTHLWLHRDLIKQLTWREVIGRYKGSYLGVGWSFIQPLLMLTVYTFVFSSVLNAKWGLGPTESKGVFALTLFTGLITFGVFSDVLTTSPSLVLENPNYVKKVVFPLEILPVVRLLSSLTHAGFSVIVLLIGILVVTRSLHYTIVFLPIVWLPMVLFTLGIGYFFASLGVFIRDLQHSVGIVSTILLFLSAIFYPLNALPENLKWFSRINPIVTFVEDARQVVIFGQHPIWIITGIMTVTSMLVLLMGFIWFMRTKKAFADVM